MKIKPKLRNRRRGGSALKWRPELAIIGDRPESPDQYAKRVMDLHAKHGKDYIKYVREPNKAGYYYGRT